MNAELLTIETDGASAGLRADVFVTNSLEALLDDAPSRSYVQNLFDEGLVVRLDAVIPKNYRLRAGDSLTVTLPKPQSAEALPQDIPLDIVYEDESLIVINKPKGMVVHPAAGNPDGTLVNALLFHCKGSLSGINGVERPGIVHRIDKDTSGLLVAAKTNEAHISLARQLSEHTVTRRYAAVAVGRLKELSGTIDRPIGRDPRNRLRFCVTDKNSRNAITHFETLSLYDAFTFLSLRLETGRTHQIRVHMSYLGHPLAGDELYGAKAQSRYFEGQCLHAKTLGFDHPVTGERMEFSSELPEYFERFLRSLSGKAEICL